jgi:5-methylcytosine-specific restriction endonuclease McrA
MIDASLRGLVWRRAQGRCEYCRLPQHAIEATFHVEHIFALQHLPHDADALDNLALACHQCNLHKGTNLTSIDPATGLVAPLYHPRRDNWQDHFAIEGAAIVGVTAIGRATAQLLQFNTHRRLELREGLIAEGDF